MNLDLDLATGFEAEPESCLEVRESFSGYLDGAITGHEMRRVADHLEDCANCHKEFALWRSMQQALVALRATKVPGDMGLKLRVAISQQKARQNRRWADVFAVRWENAVRPMLIQISAGFAGTLVLVGSILMLVGLVAVPDSVMAHDVPLGAMTAPHYLYSVANERPIVTDHDTTIVVEAAVNSAGRVYDYKVVSGPLGADVEKQIAEQLMLGVFEPARVFGTPVRGRVVMTFAGISVRA